ncbi:hypothetical protein A3F38_00695 [Candidatus Saccharibacteria bacterium RIFCSPHIGHO2_12_FULL_48_21]|nr:MAG: hypothetical protein A3F38_00695 [Candidatus Saccharibacteria bacterium RIFCSPHIGHO2_12_FULL_48_21]
MKLTLFGHAKLITVIRTSEKQKLKRSWQDAAKRMFDRRELGLVRLPASENAQSFSAFGSFAPLWRPKVVSSSSFGKKHQLF